MSTSRMDVTRVQSPAAPTPAHHRSRHVVVGIALTLLAAVAGLAYGAYRHGLLSVVRDPDNVSLCFPAVPAPTRYQVLVVPNSGKGVPRAVDLNTGDVWWTAPPQYRGWRIRAIIGDRVILSHQHELTAVSRSSGMAAWTLTGLGDDEACSPSEHEDTGEKGMVSIVGDVIFYGIDDRLYNINCASGERVWEKRSSCYINTVFATQDVAAFANNDNELTCLDSRSGRERWWRRSPNPGNTPEITSPYPSICGNEHALYVVSDSIVQALSPETGRWFWEYLMGGTDCATIRCMGDYLVANNGTNVVCFRYGRPLWTHRVQQMPLSNDDDVWDYFTDTSTVIAGDHVVTTGARIRTEVRDLATGRLMSSHPPVHGELLVVPVYESSVPAQHRL